MKRVSKRKIRIQFEIRGKYKGAPCHYGGRWMTSTGGHRNFMHIAKAQEEIHNLMEKDGWTDFAIMNMSGDVR